MQNKFLLPIAVLSVVLIGSFGWKLHQDKQQVYELTLATGTKTGNYYPFGQAIAEVVVQQNPRIRIQVVETPGAEENMRRLEANEAQLAIDLLQEELFDIFKQVIVDLDKDRIDSDSFHSFTFTW